MDKVKSNERLLLRNIKTRVLALDCYMLCFEMGEVNVYPERFEWMGIPE